MYDSRSEIMDALKDGKKKELFELFKDMTEYCKTTIGSQARPIFCLKYSWEIPSENAFTKISEIISRDTKILDVGSGLGLFARILEMYGYSVIATDHCAWYPDNDDYFYDIKKIPAIPAIEKYSDSDVDTLMMSWPDYNKSFAYDSLNTFKGNYFIYFGEGRGGCCGTNEFFSLLDEKFDKIAESSTINWLFQGSSMRIYRRKPVQVVAKEVSEDVTLTSAIETEIASPVNIVDKPPKEAPKKVLNRNGRRYYSNEELNSFSEELLDFIEYKLEEEVQSIDNGKKINIFNWVAEFPDKNPDFTLNVYRIIFNNRRINFSVKLEELARSKGVSCTVFHWKKMILHSIYEKLI